MNGKSKMKKKLVSLLMVLALLVTMVPAAAFAQGDGSAKNPVVVYRNPELDPAGEGLPSGNYLELIGQALAFDVRSTTMEAWHSQIASAKGVSDSNGVQYYVETFGGYNIVTNTIYGIRSYGAFFGWNAAAGGTAGTIGKESRVQLVKDGVAVTDDFNVAVKGYVDIKYDIDGDKETEADQLKDQVSLNYAINDAEEDFNSSDTDYAAAVAAANAKAAEKTNAANGNATYTFAGWDYTGDGKADTELLGKTIDVTAINGAVAAESVEGKTLVAVFDKDATDYTVTWDPANGEEATKETVEYGEKPSTTPADPEKAATDEYTYTFTGWEVTSGELATDGTVKGNVTYTAQYSETKNKYTVTWKNNGGTVINEVSVEYGVVPTAPTGFTAENQEEGKTYTFTGWTPAVDKVKENAEYTAVYSTADVFYTVTFDAAGGTTVADATVGHGETITANTATTRDGYRFVCWTLYDEEFDFTTEIKNDITLVAKWVELVTVTFNTNGGTSVESETIDTNTAVEKPADPVKANAVFKGWYTDEACTKAYDFNTKVTENTTLYAGWANVYTVKFNANGGTGEMEAQTVTEGSEFELPDCGFTHDGYDFVGWATDAYAAEEGILEEDPIVAGDMTLYAIWEESPAVETTITAKDVTVTYGAFTMNDIVTAAAPAVKTKDGGDVVGALVTAATDITNENVGTYDVTLKFTGETRVKAGAVEYAPSETAIKVTIEPAIGEVVVKSQNIKYGEVIVNPIEANCKTIDVLVGLDVHDETSLVGTAQAAVPADLLLLLGLATSGTDIDLNDLSLEDLETLLKNAKGVNSTIDLGIAKLKEYEDSIRELIDTLKAVQEELPIDTELKISVVPALVMPENIGLYMIGSIMADDNYTAASEDGSNANMDAGYLIIAPNGIKTNLTWNDIDDNDIITLNKIAKFDFAATAKIDESTVEGAEGFTDEGAQSHVEYMFIGVDIEGLVIDRCTDPKAAAEALTVGAYAQVAYVANWDNEMYYAEPIARPIVVSPNVVDVDIIDANGNENYAQVYTYGEDIALKVTVDGEEAPVEGLKVKYIGSDTTVDGWYRDELPTDAGVYTVVATYTENDENGSLYKAGGAVGVLIINPADAEVGLNDAKYEYNGEQHFAELTNTGLDYITVAIDRDENIAYVNMPEDTKAHVERIVAMLPAKAEDAVNEYLDKYADFDGDVQMSTLKGETNDVLQAIIDADMTAAAKAEANKLVDALVEELKANEDVKDLAAKIEEELEALKDKIGEEIPDEIEAELTQYIKDAVTVNEDGTVDIDTDKIKDDLDAMIAKVESELPASAVAELKEMKDEIVKAVENNIDVEGIEAKLTEITSAVEGLTEEDIAKLALKAAYEAYGYVDKDAVKDLAKEVIYKIEAQGYIDYAENMIESIKGMYGGDVDTSDLEAAIKDLVNDSKAAIKDGNIDAESLATLETYIDNILKEMQGVVGQLPEGTIIFGQNPSEVGIYDCYAINISANYKAEFVEADLEIYEKEEPTDPSQPTDPTDPSQPTDPTDPTDPTNPTDPVEPTDPTDPVDPEDPTEPPLDDETDTGDDMNLVVPIALAAAAVAAMAAVVATRRRQN